MVVTKFKNIRLLKTRFLSILKQVVTFSLVINIGLTAGLSQAAVLGAERLDVLYHSCIAGMQASRCRLYAVECGPASLTSLASDWFREIGFRSHTDDSSPAA